MIYLYEKSQDRTFDAFFDLFDSDVFYFIELVSESTCFYRWH